MNLLDAFFEILYPPRCIICDEPVLNYGYCDDCKGKLTPIKHAMCLSCGCEEQYCECKNRIYHFDGVAGPYFNEEYAQQAVYDFKFSKKFNCVKPFSKAMANCAKNSFGLENIDIICCVPASKKSLYERGFNQSEVLAKEVSELLKINCDSGLLIKSNKVKTQHRIKNYSDRFKNVRNKFKTTKNLSGKNVLLVDDIKTSGATLDECARQLKFSGAENVYCLVALLSRYNPKNKSIDL